MWAQRGVQVILQAHTMPFTHAKQCQMCMPSNDKCACQAMPNMQRMLGTLVGTEGGLGNTMGTHNAIYANQAMTKVYAKQCQICRECWAHLWAQTGGVQVKLWAHIMPFMHTKQCQMCRECQICRQCQLDNANCVNDRYLLSVGGQPTVRLGQATPNANSSITMPIVHSDNAKCADNAICVLHTMPFMHTMPIVHTMPFVHGAQCQICNSYTIGIVAQLAL